MIFLGFCQSFLAFEISPVSLHLGKLPNRGGSSAVETKPKVPGVPKVNKIQKGIRVGRADSSQNL
jgi:hypothetical protein